MTALVKVDTKAGDARMIAGVAERFDALRQDVLDQSGVDFLAVCGDVLRPAGYVSSKDGVANRSWHKTGRAFDYDQTSKALVIVSEIIGGKQYFRTYLRCAEGLGVKLSVRDMRGYNVSAYLFDFTAAAERRGFRRIPAWAGWQRNYNRREFWHYQRDEGLAWATAMAQISGKSAAPTQKAVTAGVIVVGLNDRDSNTGGRVSLIQKRLNALGILASKEIDGIFGKHTLAAVREFQRRSSIAIDGDVGPATSKALGI